MRWPTPGAVQTRRAATTCSRLPPRRCATHQTRYPCCARVYAETGVALEVLPGEDEARFTVLAVRRWFGWSAGRLLVIDIGGGSLELASGMDELPSVAASVPLGAGRLTREWFSAEGHSHAPPSRRKIEALRAHVDGVLAPVAARLATAGVPDRAVGTSKTFRSLARLAGAAPSSAGPRARRVLTAVGLHQLAAFISRMSASDLAELGRGERQPGTSSW